MPHLFLAGLLCLSTAAFADLTLVNEAVTQGKARTVTLSAKGNKSYLEIKEADGPARSMLRDAEAKKLFIIDHVKKVVLVITEEDSKQLEEKQAAFRAQLQAQLARMPPEQRARMEAGLLNQVDGKKAVYTYEKKKGPARKIGKYACRDYSIKRDGQPGGEGCFASWKDMGITADEFKAVMLNAIPSAAGSVMAHGFEAAESAPGFPVWRSHVNADGVVTTQTTLQSISRTALPAKNFELPKDYPQKGMANMGQPIPPPAPAAK